MTSPPRYICKTSWRQRLLLPSICYSINSYGGALRMHYTFRCHSLKLNHIKTLKFLDFFLLFCLLMSAILISEENLSRHHNMQYILSRMSLPKSFASKVWKDKILFLSIKTKRWCNLCNSIEALHHQYTRKKASRSNLQFEFSSFEL